LLKLSAEVDRQFQDATEENAKDIVAVAKILIEERSGDSRREISYLGVGDGSVLIYFGKKAKVIEGNRGPSPFVNPALVATKRNRSARNRKALRDAIKAV
jgi:hypothetical protein